MQRGARSRFSPEFTARLVDYWQKHRNDAPRLPTTAEAFASVFSMVADQERRQVAQQQELKAIGDRIDRVAQELKKGSASTSPKNSNPSPGKVISIGSRSPKS